MAGCWSPHLRSAAGRARCAREGGTGIPEKHERSGPTPCVFPGSQSHPPAGPAARRQRQTAALQTWPAPCFSV